MPLKTSCVYMTNCLDRVWENSVSFKPVPPGCCTSHQLCFILGTGLHLKAAVGCVGGGEEILRLYMKLRPSISNTIFSEVILLFDKWAHKKEEEKKRFPLIKACFKTIVWPKTICLSVNIKQYKHAKDREKGSCLCISHQHKTSLHLLQWIHTNTHWHRNQVSSLRKRGAG